MCNNVYSSILFNKTREEFHNNDVWFQACVMAPYVFWVLVACKGLLPRAVFDKVCEFLGRRDVMTQFKGRGTAEQVK